MIPSGRSSFMPCPAYGGRLSGLNVNVIAPGTPRLSTMFSSGLQFTSFSSFSPFSSFDGAAKSVWNAPELPAEAFNSHAIAPTVIRRRIAAKALAAPEDDGSDEDDIIMGNTSTWMKYRAEETDQAPVPTEPTPRRSHAANTAAGTQDKAVKPTGRRQHDQPQLVLRVPSPVVQYQPSQKTAPEPQEVVKQAERRKRGRPRAVLQGHSPARADNVSRAPAPESSFITEIAPHTPQEVVTREERRKPGRPRTKVRKPSPVLEERRKRGRPRKQPEADLPVQGAASKKRTAAKVVPDSDTEFLEFSPALESNADPADESSNDTSGAELLSRPANSLSRVEVQLVRRRRLNITEAQEAVAGKNMSADEKEIRSLFQQSIPPMRKDQPDRIITHALPAAQSPQHGSPATCSIAAKISTGSAVVMKSHDAQTSEVSEQRRPAGEPEKGAVARPEQFSRNTIDKDYDFSDNDESFVPPSRAKRSARQAQLPSSTPRRGLARRVANNAFTGSSPSIRAALPSVKKSFRSTATKVRQAGSSPKQPGSSPRGDVSAPISQDMPGVEGPMTPAADGPEPSSPIPDDPLSPTDLDPAVDEPQTTAMPSTPSSKQSKKKPAPAAPALVTPSSRQSKSKPTATPSATRPSTSKRSILSLLSDSDEDELSLSLDQISPLVRSVAKQHPPLPLRSRSTAKKLPAVRRLSLGSYARATPTQQRSRLSGGWKSASAAKRTHKLTDVDNGDVHRTPGGTMRRCGEDGFKCERDFCFACL